MRGSASVEYISSAPVASGGQDVLRELVRLGKVGRMTGVYRENASTGCGVIHALLSSPGNSAILGQLDVDPRDAAEILLRRPDRRFCRGERSARLRCQQSIRKRNVIVEAVGV